VRCPFEEIFIGGLVPAAGVFCGRDGKVKEVKEAKDGKEASNGEILRVAASPRTVVRCLGFYF
jgi:hypothetical protein